MVRKPITTAIVSEEEALCGRQRGAYVNVPSSLVPPSWQQRVAASKSLSPPPKKVGGNRKVQGVC